ncbi:UTP--glucose-1-phosphate uridylyltransferase [Pseudoclavibacter triregionum]|nr:UTP--glucose-1-phosphate uridylyltransferase [Pseudoclavibacter triregionum]
MTDSRLTKAVIPAAGLGTRFLPATKAMPKEMLPVVDRPAIQYVVEEAVRAGLTDVLMITGRNKNALENHFDRVTELEALLEARGDVDRLSKVNASTDLANLHYVRQGDPKGLGHAVLRARMHVGREPFAVLLGDDLIDEGSDLLERMVAAQAETGATIVALMEVEPSQISSYGCAAIEPYGGGPEGSELVRVTGLVEKPRPEDAPSNLAIIGRYVLRPEIFDILRETRPGRGGEIQLTDALNVLAEDRELAGGVLGIVFRGRRHDTGDKLGYIQAIVELAVDHPELSERLRPWLKEFADGLSAGDSA